MRDEAEIAPQVLRRLDVLWSATLGTVMADHIRSANLQTRHLILSLKAGEPHRLARAFAVEAGIVSSAGPRVRQVNRLLGHTEALNEPLEDRYLDGWIAAIRGLAAYQRGELEEALELCDLAAETWTPQSHKRLFTSASVAFFQTYVGVPVLAVEPLLPRTLPRGSAPGVRYPRGRRRRGDRYTETNTSTSVTSIAWLVADEIEQATNAWRPWWPTGPRRGFTFAALLGGGKPRTDRVVSGQGRRGLVRHLRRVEAAQAFLLADRRDRGCRGVGSTGEGGVGCGVNVPRQTRGAEAAAAEAPAGRSTGPSRGRGSALRRGGYRRLPRDLKRAHSAFVRMSMHAAVASWRRGVLVGGNQGRELVQRRLARDEGGRGALPGEDRRAACAGVRAEAATHRVAGAQSGQPCGVILEGERRGPGSAYHREAAARSITAARCRRSAGLHETCGPRGKAGREPGVL